MDFSLGTQYLSKFQYLQALKIYIYVSIYIDFFLIIIERKKILMIYSK